MTQAKTLFEKLWDSHVVRSLGENLDLLHVDRLLIHDLSGSRALTDLKERGLSVRNPELCLSTPDHSVSSLPGRTLASSPNGERLGNALREMSAAAGVARSMPTSSTHAIPSNEYHVLQSVDRFWSFRVHSLVSSLRSMTLSTGTTVRRMMLPGAKSVDVGCTPSA